MSNGFEFAHRPEADPGLQARSALGHGRNHRPLMADIARSAGVSIATVSRALSGGGMVAADTRAHIQAIARSLHYGVDERARDLRLGQNHTVAVVVPKMAEPGTMPADPFSLELLCSIADALAEQGHATLLSRPDRLQPETLAHDIETGRACGLVIVGQGHHHAQLQALARRGTPFVVWGAPTDGQTYATVGSDNLVGGRLAAGHLLDRGARRVVFLGDTRLPEMAQRHAGYLQAHRARGVQPLTVQAPQWPDALVPLQAWQQQGSGIDAVFAGSDLLALGALRSLRQWGRCVPDDILVAGYDNTAMAAQCHPPITSVCSSTAMAGRALVQVLQAVRDGRRPSPTLLPTRLQVRQSSAVGLRALGLADAPRG